MWMWLLVLGGLFNLYNFYRRFGSSEDMPHINQGYLMAFFMGALIYGGPMCLLFAIVS